MSNAGVLAIEHVGEAGFVLKRLSASDVKSLDAVTIPSPYEFAVEGQPNSNLMRELRWYLEDFLDYPFHPDTLKAEHVLDALRGWGTKAFNALFDRRDAGTWLGGASVLQVRSDDPNILSWPWEALYDPQLNYVSQHRSVERRLNKIADPPALGDLPTDCVNILLVVARPYKGDVRYRSIARPLVEMIREKGLPAHVDVLRPPTFGSGTRLSIGFGSSFAPGLGFITCCTSMDTGRLAMAQENMLRINIKGRAAAWFSRMKTVRLPRNRPAT